MKDLIVSNLDNEFDRQFGSISVAEVFSHFKLRQDRLSSYLLKFLLWLPTKRFGQLAGRFDRRVGESGLYQAMGSLRHRFINHIEISGESNVPAEGPLLVVSNHPGAADAVALLSTIPRPDIHLIVSDRKILRALTHTSRYFIFLNTQVINRMEVLRGVVRALRNREAVLFYPGGGIEPDPAMIPGAVESISKWSQSIGLFLAKVPNVNLLPVVVSGAFSPQAWRSFLSQRGRTVRERQQIAMILQVAVQQVFPNLWPVTTHVHFAPPITPAELDAELHPDHLYQAAIEYIRSFMAQFAVVQRS
jgi:1-acyl-sn-glycerol-3-phosphate acyltransferase